MSKSYVTIGQLAKSMNVTVRTLQYYDKEGLLKPSVISEGGRRLYSAKDVVRLHQILSFKYLGFTLEQIKDQLFHLDDPSDVANILKNQKETIDTQIQQLHLASEAIKALYEEVTLLNKVDFERYAEIVELLKVGNQGYWLWKHFDDPLKDHIRNRFKDNPQAGLDIFETYKIILEEAITLKRQGFSSRSDHSLSLAKRWWDMVLEFTGGDLSLIPQLEAFSKSKDQWNHELAIKQKEVDEFLEEALVAYFDTMKKSE